MYKHTHWPVCVLVMLWVAVPAAAQRYQFTLNPLESGLTADLSIDAQTFGTLIGNYDPVSNPTGTRTKPGLLGTFGSTENVAARVEVDPRVAGSGLSLRTSGGFVLSLDTAGGTVSMSGLAADFLAGGPLTLPVSAQVSIIDAFRTRNPDSLFPAASVNIPLGDATVTALAASQVEGPATGTLTAVGPGQYSFTLSPMIALSGKAEFSGTELEFPATPVALMLSGQITVSGDSAAVSGSATLDLSFTDPTDAPLEPFPFDLPTVLPAGNTAHVILNLTLDQIATAVDGTQAVSATGVDITQPGDADLSGTIDIRDYLAIDRGRALGLTGWSSGDFTGDGAIDGEDYAVIDRAFLAQQAGPGAPGVVVPEAGAIPGAVAAMCLLRRKRPGQGTSNRDRLRNHV